MEVLRLIQPQIITTPFASYSYRTIYIGVSNDSVAEVASVHPAETYKHKSQN